MERAPSGRTKHGEIIHSYRLRAGLSAAKLAQRSGVPDTSIKAIERQRGVPTNIIYPNHFNRLHDVLGFTGYEVLEAMGYQTDAGLANINPNLLYLIQKLTPEQQLAAIDAIRAGLRFVPSPS